MLSFSDLKDGDTFYYVLKSFRSDEHWNNFITLSVFAYEFHEKFENSFDERLMFRTREAAEKYIDHLINLAWNCWDNDIDLVSFTNELDFINRKEA